MQPFEGPGSGSLGAVSVERRRGRPRVFSDEELGVAASLFPDVDTRRGLQNCLYAVSAARALEPLVADHPELLRLADLWRGAKPGEHGLAWRQSVLVELGRALRVLTPDVWLTVALIVARSAELPIKDQTGLVRYARRNGVTALIELTRAGSGRAW